MTSGTSCRSTISIDSTVGRRRDDVRNVNHDHTATMALRPREGTISEKLCGSLVSCTGDS